MQSLGMNHCDLTDFWLILCPSFSVFGSCVVFSVLFLQHRCSSVEGLVRAKGPRASPDLAPELAARWPDAGKTKMEETGLLLGSLLEKGGFGCVTLCLYVTQMLGIGLVFAFSRWRQSHSCIMPSLA